MKKIGLALVLFTFYSCGQNNTEDKSKTISDSTALNKQFFADDSYWNMPIPENPEIDPRNEHYIKMLEKEPNMSGFVINIEKWTIPVYEVDDSTPRYKIGLHYLDDEEKKLWNTARNTYGHGKEFAADSVPIPANAIPDGETDAHLAIVDYKNRVAWDMWGLKKSADGSWQSKTGMKYSLDGDGTFKTSDFNVKDGESIHFHGPSRASAVPAIAGLIMYDEAKSGEIKHKLAACSRFVALQKFTYPAAWTDGFMPDGLPEGTLLQLDPKLDLSQFPLLPGEVAVAKAAQKYGIVLVDWGGGQALYGEGLWSQPGKSWDGLLRFSGGIDQIPYKHFRILKIGEVVNRGDDKRKADNPVQNDR